MMHISPSASKAAEQCAQYLAQLIEDAVQERGVATIALSGGSTPKLMFEFLLKERVPWHAVELFQVDERGVPPGHAQSNYTMIEEHLLKPAGIDTSRMHRMRGELDAKDAAALYAHELEKTLDDALVADVVVCGIGGDAHTASLFPGDRLIENRQDLVAATWVEKMGQWRITLLPRVLLNARNLLVLAAGSDKSTAFTHIFDDRTPVLDAPAKVLFETSGSLHWYLDESAAPN